MGDSPIFQEFLEKTRVIGGAPIRRQFSGNSERGEPAPKVGGHCRSICAWGQCNLEPPSEPINIQQKLMALEVKYISGGTLEWESWCYCFDKWFHGL